MGFNFVFMHKVAAFILTNSVEIESEYLLGTPIY